MRHIFLILRIFGVVLCSPAMGLACVYPSALQVMNNTLVDVQNGGGQVQLHHRDRLRSALSGLNPAAMQLVLTSDITRANMRSVAEILTVSRALADGIGQTLTADMAQHLQNLSEAVHKECVDALTTAESGTQGSGMEHGERRRLGDAGTALTFQQGLTRLSVTFTIYILFLWGVIVLRRMQRAAASQTARKISDSRFRPPIVPAAHQI